jgi:hypothetical protein
VTRMAAVMKKAFHFWWGERWFPSISKCNTSSVGWYLWSKSKEGGHKYIGFDSACHLLSRWYFARLIHPWRWRLYVPQKRRLTSSGLQGVISQNTVLFKGHKDYSHKDSLVWQHWTRREQECDHVFILWRLSSNDYKYTFIVLWGTLTP